MGSPTSLYPVGFSFQNELGQSRTTTFQYSAAKRLAVAQTHNADGETASVSFDDNGNMVGKTYFPSEAYGHAAETYYYNAVGAAEGGSHSAADGSVIRDLTVTFHSGDLNHATLSISGAQTETHEFRMDSVTGQLKDYIKTASAFVTNLIQNFVWME